MANLRISALPAASTPLAGTELVPVVQGGITEQVTVANLTAGRAISTAGVTLTTGNLNLSGAAQVITGDFGSGTTTNRVAFQTNIVNGDTRVSVIPNGTGSLAGVALYTDSARATGPFVLLEQRAAETRFNSTANLAVDYKPFNFWSGGAQRLQLTVAGDVSVTTGNLVIATSGKGIDFSATAGTGTSELLADYEEGTWTPVVSDASTGGNTATVGTTVGTYTKIGRQVTVRLSLDNITTTGMTAANQLFVQGLPYTAASGVAQAPGAMYVSRISFTGGAYSWTASVAASATVMAFFSPTGADSNAASMKVSNILSSGADLYATVTYFV